MPVPAAFSGRAGFRTGDEPSEALLLPGHRHANPPRSSPRRHSVRPGLLSNGIKNITFPATITEDGELIRINATFDVNRRDFGILYATGPADLLRDEVVIHLRLEATPAE